MILLAKPLTIAAGVCLKPFMDPLCRTEFPNFRRDSPSLS